METVASLKQEILEDKGRGVINRKEGCSIQYKFPEEKSKLIEHQHSFNREKLKLELHEKDNFMKMICQIYYSIFIEIYNKFLLKSIRNLYLN